MVFQHVGDAEGDHRGFTGAGTGNDQKGAMNGFSSLSLLGIELGKVYGHGGKIAFF